MLAFCFWVEFCLKVSISDIVYIYQADIDIRYIGFKGIIVQLFKQVEVFGSCGFRVEGWAYYQVGVDDYEVLVVLFFVDFLCGVFCYGFGVGIGLIFQGSGGVLDVFCQYIFWGIFYFVGIGVDGGVVVGEDYLFDGVGFIGLFQYVFCIQDCRVYEVFLCVFKVGGKGGSGVVNQFIVFYSFGVGIVFQ